MPSTLRNSPDIAPCQSAHQQDTGDCGALPQPQTLQGSTASSAGSFGTPCTVHNASSFDAGADIKHDSEAACQAPHAEPSNGPAQLVAVASVAPTADNHNQEATLGDSSLEQVSWAVDPGVLDEGNEPGSFVCTPESPKRQPSGSTEELFPETNFEDSEDDSGCMAMFKSYMNDHTAYDTKRSRILEISTSTMAEKELPTARERLSEHDAPPFDGAPMQQGTPQSDTSRLSSRPSSLAGTEAAPLQQVSAASSTVPFSDIKGVENRPDTVQKRSESKASSRSERSSAGSGKPNVACASAGTASDKPADIPVYDLEEVRATQISVSGAYAPPELGSCFRLSAATDTLIILNSCCRLVMHGSLHVCVVTIFCITSPSGRVYATSSAELFAIQFVCHTHVLLLAQGTWLHA